MCQSSLITIFVNELYSMSDWQFRCYRVELNKVDHSNQSLGSRTLEVAALLMMHLFET